MLLYIQVKADDAESPKAYTTEDYLKITEDQLKVSSPGKSQTEDQIQTQEPAVQSQPEVTSRETMAASPPSKIKRHPKI
ncbi:unnamed protein product [Brassica rapa subsp. narinosa]